MLLRPIVGKARIGDDGGFQSAQRCLVERSTALGRCTFILPQRQCMNDLPDRIDQIQGVIRASGCDARRLRETCFHPRVQVEFDSEAAGMRRHYVRAVFALIEAVVEQHWLLLVDLSDGTEKKLRKMRPTLLLLKKVAVVYESAGLAFGQYIGIGCEPLMAAKEIPNRLTHPKSFEDCQVGVLDLDKVEEAEKWFREFNNKFMAAVAARYAASHRLKTGTHALS
jgi:hypothetical protein